MKWFCFSIVSVHIACLLAIGSVYADDTDIYGGGSISVQPNVLIIFDTSGSMSTKDVGDYYDPEATYSGSYAHAAVYEKVCGWGCTYNLFASDIEDLNCPDTRKTIKNSGYTNDDIYNSSGNFECGGTDRELYLGNWLNYDATPQTTRTRIDVAKEVITDLIQDTNDVRFGLMRFNYDQGGCIVTPISPITTQKEKDALKADVNALTANGYTPLAETLAEAGLYYAGKNSWFNGGINYTTPVQNRCQKNYIILMTDGEPTRDDDWKLRTGSYINNDQIGDYDNDGSSGKLDDVSAYLFEEDILMSMGTVGQSFQRQNIITYTIGFKTEQDLLGATVSNSGGQYYTAQSTSGLKAAFQEIMATIVDVNAVFVSPVVPVSRMNHTFAGNFLYVSFFKPQNSGRWDGNIKKYSLDSQGNLIDKNGNPATLADGTIRDNAQSFWSIQANGPDVLLGGTGGVLLDQFSRNLYTYLASASSPSLDLTNSRNAFITGNTNITAPLLGVPTTGDKDDLIRDVHGVGRSWILGDFLHSKPAVIYYDTNGDQVLDEAFIYAGGNDGILHSFKDSDGSEQWGFIPPDQLERLKLLIDTDTTHEYYVDGAPVVYEANDDPINGQKILFFGERRGGTHYHALDITSHNSPSYLYKIGSGILTPMDGDNNGSPDGANAMLGQSWCTPVKGRIRTAPTPASAWADILLLGGGYDVNQDNQTPAETDSLGRAIFAIDVATGSVTGLNVNAGNVTQSNTQMTHSIVDVAGFDSNGSGYINRIYAGDLGGSIFAMQDDDEDGSWELRKLFIARNPSASPPDNVQRKIMYSPDAVREVYGDMIFFGTGDRADPNETGVVNRIYAVKNEWTDPANWTIPNDPNGFKPLTENDLVDVTDNLLYLGTEQQQADTEAALDTKKGWFIRLEDLGEKVTANVTVYAGVVYFTTYTPESGAPPSTDPCEVASGRGTARLYAVDYLNGSAVYNWSDSVEVVGSTGVEVEAGKGKADRSKIIGTSIPSAPVFAVLPGGAKMYIGVEGGVAKQDPGVVADVKAFYWRDIR